MFDHACRYVRFGWPVFPLREGSKLPATAHGCKDATTDLEQIAAWFDTARVYNLGIATGFPGPDVLDIDVKNGVDGARAVRLLDEVGLLPDAGYRVRTPSGGFHFYYSGSAQSNGSLVRWGLDFRSLGGYVVAPPSIIDGSKYGAYTGRGDVAGAFEPFDWVAARTLLAPPSTNRPVAPSSSPSNGLAGLVRWVNAQPVGNRNQGLYWAACRAVEDGHTDLTSLIDAGVAIGLSDIEATATVRSASKGRS